MNPLLESIAVKASADLCDLIREGEADILTAIHKMQTEAQAQETAPKFNLSFKIAVDFDKSSFDCDLSWTLKQSLSVSHQIDDPNQGKLPMDEVSKSVAKFATIPADAGIESMTISGGDKSVTITKEDAKRIKKALAKK